MISKSSRWSIIATDLICFLDYCDFSGIKGIFTVRFSNALAVTLYPGNSARLIRSGICVLLPIFVAALLKLFHRLLKEKSNEEILSPIIVGLCSAVSVLWSNDYGISSFIVFNLFFAIYIIVHLKNARKLIVTIAIDTLSFIITLATILLIATHGDIKSYFVSTLGVSSYQPWYAVHTTSINYYITQIIPNDINFYIAIAIIIVLIRKYIINSKNYDVNKTPSAKNEGDLLIAYILGTSVFAILLYRVSDGGGTEYFDICYSFTILLFIAYKCTQFIKAHALNTNSNTVRTCLNMAIIVWMICICTNSAYQLATNNLAVERGGKYIPELGGNLSSLQDSVTDASEYLNGRNVISTYASAVESTSGVFNPTGIDYIIHALGDDKRVHYLEVFNSEDDCAASIIRQSFSGWENYIRGSNWFFYRELYEKYVPVFGTEYQYYYEKSSASRKELIENTITTSNTEPSKVEIEIDCDSTFSGLADIHLSYGISKKDSLAGKLCYKQILAVYDTNSPNYNVALSFCLPSSQSDCYLPIIIRNGKGKLILESNPTNNTFLEVANITCTGMFRNALNLGVVKFSNRLDDGTYMTTFSVEDRNEIDATKMLRCGDIDIPIVSITNYHDGTASVITEGDVLHKGDAVVFITS